MKYCIYQFEAVSIQEYILSSGKLKSMVGASELLEAITGQLLDETIHQMGLELCSLDSLGEGELELTDTQVVFPRRAGSVFLMVLKNETIAKQFEQLWPILVSGFAPGLRFSAALKTGDDFNEVAAAVRDELNTQKNQPQTQLPESTPVTVRFAKTGQAQIQYPSNTSDGLDWTMRAKVENEFESLSSKHLTEGSENPIQKYKFPKVFDHQASKDKTPGVFPFKSNEPGNHTVAIIHTDGNSLGGYLHKIFAELNQQTPGVSVKAYADFSLGLDKATQVAAQVATRWLVDSYVQDEVLENQQDEIYLPMRPLILGGDDLTCIVRADYALGFIESFTSAFENTTASFVTTIKQKYPKVFDILPSKLTCTTGAIFIKSNQPFSQGYALAEELCASAKKEGRNISANTPPSLVSFLHTTNTLFDELDVQLNQELKTSQGLDMSCMPYAFVANQGRQTLHELFALTSCFSKTRQDKLNPSALRTYAGHLHQDAEYAQVHWNRWANRSKEDKQLSQTWQDFESSWKNLSKQTAMPVADLVSMLGLEVKNPYSNHEGAR